MRRAPQSQSEVLLSCKCFFVEQAANWVFWCNLDLTIEVLLALCPGYAAEIGAITSL